MPDDAVGCAAVASAQGGVRKRGGLITFLLRFALTKNIGTVFTVECTIQ